MSEQLTADAVEATFDACLGPIDGDAIDVAGIMANYRMDRAAVEAHGEQIAMLLLGLPDQFKESGGGGWSFLNACDDRNGRQWTGLHRTMEHLFVLGMAAGMVASLLPRELWDALPGGMPYYVVKDKTFAADRIGGDRG